MAIFKGFFKNNFTKKLTTPIETPQAIKPDLYEKEIIETE